MLSCRHLWQSCEELLSQLGNGSEACLRLQQVHSLAELEQQHGPYDAVVVAAGAAAAMLPEVGAHCLQHICGRLCFTGDRLSLLRSTEASCMTLRCPTAFFSFMLTVPVPVPGIREGRSQHFCTPIQPVCCMCAFAVCCIQL